MQSGSSQVAPKDIAIKEFKSIKQDAELFNQLQKIINAWEESERVPSELKNFPFTLIRTHSEEMLRPGKQYHHNSEYHYLLLSKSDNSYLSKVPENSTDNSQGKLGRFADVLLATEISKNTQGIWDFNPISLRAIKRQTSASINIDDFVTVTRNVKKEYTYTKSILGSQGYCVQVIPIEYNFDLTNPLEKKSGVLYLKKINEDLFCEFVDVNGVKLESSISCSKIANNFPEVITLEVLERFKEDILIFTTEDGLTPPYHIISYLDVTFLEDMINLRDLLKKKITLTAAFNIAIHFISALKDLHEIFEIIHKDIKPHNVMVHPETLEVKIIDFGLSKEITKESVEQGGSLLFIPPSRIDAQEGPKSDSYPAGAVLAEIFGTDPKSLYGPKNHPLIRTEIGTLCVPYLFDTLLSGLKHVRITYEQKKQLEFLLKKSTALFESERLSPSEIHADLVELQQSVAKNQNIAL